MNDLEPVKSSHLSAVGYNAKTKMLQIRFKGNDALYEYSGVPSDLATGLMSAESTGKYFNTHIRPKYKGVRHLS